MTKTTFRKLAMDYKGVLIQRMTRKTPTQRPSHRVEGFPTCELCLLRKGSHSTSPGTAGWDAETEQQGLEEALPVSRLCYSQESHRGRIKGDWWTKSPFSCSNYSCSREQWANPHGGAGCTLSTQSCLPFSFPRVSWSPGAAANLPGRLHLFDCLLTQEPTPKS